MNSVFSIMNNKGYPANPAGCRNYLHHTRPKKLVQVTAEQSMVRKIQSKYSTCLQENNKIIIYNIFTK